MHTLHDIMKNIIIQKSEEKKKGLNSTTVRCFLSFKHIPFPRLLIKSITSTENCDTRKILNTNVNMIGTNHHFPP